MGLPKVIDLVLVDVKVKAIEGVQWAEDGSNTLDVVKQFFQFLLVYDSGKESSPKMVMNSKVGVVRALPGWWFLQDAESDGVLVLAPEDFAMRYAVKK